MSLTYTDDTRTENTETVFIPAYARGKSRKKKGVKTWMILAPIGAVVLAGSAAAMFMGSGEEAAPIVEEPVAPVSAMAPIAQPPLVDSGLSTNAAPAPIEAAPTPVAAPAPRAEPAAEPVRRTPVAERRAAPEPAPAPVVEAPVEPTGPTPYTAELNSAPAASTSAQTAAPRAPVIDTQPLS